MRSAPAKGSDRAKVAAMAPDEVLSPRPRLWPPYAVAGTLGTACVAAYVNLTGDASPELVCIAGGAATISATAAARVVDRCRQRMDKLREQVAIALGYSRGISRSKVRGHRWRDFWRPHPKVITFRYAPPVHDVYADPKTPIARWDPSALAQTASQIFETDYKVWSHKPLKHKLTLRRDDAEPDSVDPVDQRAAALVSGLMGESASILASSRDQDGRLASVDIRKPADPKLAAPGYQARIERVWSAMMPGRWRGHFDLENDRIRLEVRPTFPEVIWTPVPQAAEGDDLLATYRDVEIPYAVDEDGQAALWRPAIDPNLMIVGAPGTGKTSTNHTILAQICLYGWPAWVVDGKHTEFLGFRGWPNVQIVATNVAEQVATLHRAHQVMEHRYDLIESSRARADDFEPLLVVVDEWADFLGNLYAWYQDKKIKGRSEPPVVDLVRSIARKGRTARVHLLFSTQRPDAKFFGLDMRDNFKERASMGSLTPQGAMMMWQSTTVGVAVPRNCQGRGTGVDRAGRPIEIQAYYTPNPFEISKSSPEYEHLMNLRAPESRHERLLMVPPEPYTDDSGNIEPVSYHQVATAEWVKAADRPDLDALNVEPADHESARDLASPLAVFGLTDGIAEASPADSSARSWPTAPRAAEERTGVDAEFADTDQICIADIVAGDLVLVDEDTDQWATAVSAAEPDEIEADMWCLSWRSADDEEDTTLVDADQLMSVRKPIEPDARELT